MDCIRIASGVLDVIASHARADAPRECCGLLVGVVASAGGLPEIRRAEPARNLASAATRYDVDPVDHIRILKAARREGLTVVGAYHSHPATAPVPSPTDLAEGLPNFIYLIATLLPSVPANRTICAYYFEGAAFRAVRLVTAD